MKVVVIPPCLDVRLADHVHRADQLHAFEVLAVELRHHRLDFSAVQHAHERRLDHIIEMMPQGDLVAAELLRMGVKVTAAHSRTEIARALIHVSDNVEDIALKHVDRDAEKLRVV